MSDDTADVPPSDGDPISPVTGPDPADPMADPAAVGLDPNVVTEPSGNFGRPGQPLNRRSPFYLGFVGALGVLLAIGLVSVIQHLSQVLTLLTVSLFLALGIEPVIRAVQRRGVKRSLSVVIVFIGLVLVFAALVAVVVPPVVQEASQLATEAPDYAQDLLKNRTLSRLDDQYGIIDQLTARLKSGTMWTSIFGGVLGAGKAVLSGFFSAFTVLVLTMYFAASLPAVKSSVYRMVPRSRRERFVHLSEEITKRVGGYVIGQIAIASINGALSFIMMTVVGVPYAAVLAVTVSILGLIPMVGATIGAAIVALVAVFDSPSSAVVVVVYYAIYQQLENYLIAPRIMSRTVSVPGAVTVIAALAGATLLGVIGALMAIPVAAGLLLVYQEVLLPRQEKI